MNKGEQVSTISRPPIQWRRISFFLKTEFVLGVVMLAKSVLMVSPDAFEWSQETAQDNGFMHRKQALKSDILASHQAWVALLRSKGIDVVLFPGQEQQPDGCFPNNWFATRPGLVSLFPMRHPSRRRERRHDILEVLKARYTSVVSLVSHEQDGRFLEGTGSCVVDWSSGTVFVAESQRSDVQIAQEWAEHLSRHEGRQLRVVSFQTTAGQRKAPIYHTNVVMSIGALYVVVCSAAANDAAALLHEVRLLGKPLVLDISIEQMESFCGNIIQIDRFLCMSSRAYKSFTPKEISDLESVGKVEILHLPLDEIETIGGGGVRCCIAELF